MSGLFPRLNGTLPRACLRAPTSYRLSLFQARDPFTVIEARQRMRLSRAPAITSQRRSFTQSGIRANWLQRNRPELRPSKKGRPRVRTGGSMLGTTLAFGDYGLRLKDHHRRVSAAQLKIADDTIKKRLRGEKYRLFHRVAADIGVYTSGNDVRMGKGKGSFDRWTARVAVSKIVFEIKGNMHEQVARDALRLAGNKLPGQWEFVRKGDPPVMGITQLGNGITEESLRRARKTLPIAPVPSDANTAERLPATTPP